MRLLAKHGGEDVVEILLTVALLVGLSLATEAGIVAMLPELIVFGAPLLIFQDFPCFGEILKFGFGIVFFTDVGVIFARRAAVGGLDGFQIVGWLHPENGIIILQFHDFSHLCSVRWLHIPRTGVSIKRRANAP